MKDIYYSTFKFCVDEPKQPGAKMMKTNKTSVKKLSQKGTKNKRQWKSKKYRYMRTLSLKNCIKQIDHDVYMVE